ncbi:hypothetical protein DAPPUDRAFT_259215 [Daphnia pulex]|uniref:C1q domain-containing protein n=1 Tax=Daphnia pulex TaxID=6669 RepID=E9HGU3_DAPPU|nr:hypothetical protein DAPPUDRAFT_259215 [Daphnia pulex]|eukprot:EFX69057.1 hypothetical protein DAPPUDRAFT_259215 [Daphnia pulex]
MPKSCQDLWLIGHSLNGFYSVMGSAMMESVYCNFTSLTGDEGFQKWIGYDDVKSAPVHFYGQRNFDFNTTGTPIPFELAVVKGGNAMDVPSGIFTAPRQGTYYFSFTGVAYLYSSDSASYNCYLYLNGDIIGSSHVRNKKAPVDQFRPFTLQSTLNLKKGDQLWVTFSYYGDSNSHLHDDNIHYTHFSGFMLEEEIVASV